MNDDPKLQRRDDRINAYIEASYSDGRRFFNEKIVDLSLGGCQIEALTPLDKGTDITLTLSSSPPLKLTGTVRWIKKKRFKYQMGVQFKRVTAEQEHVLRDVIQSVFWLDDKWGHY